MCVVNPGILGWAAEAEESSTNAGFRRVELALLLSIGPEPSKPALKNRIASLPSDHARPLPTIHGSPSAAPTERVVGTSTRIGNGEPHVPSHVRSRGHARWWWCRC